MRHLHKLFSAVALAAFFMACPAQAQNAGIVTAHAFAVGKGAGTTGYTSLLCTSAQLAVGQSAADPICQTITGDVTISAGGVTAIGSGTVTSADLNSNVFSTAHSWSGQQTFTAPILGTPASATLTNATGLPISSGVSGLGTGIATFLATPSSANLRSALTDEVGTGAAYFVGGALGTPASATLTNATGLPLSGLSLQAANTIVANATGAAAIPTAVDISTLTTKASPASTDLVMISDQAASGALKKVTVSSLASAGSVASIAGNTGAFTLSHGLTNSTNDIRLSLTNATLQANPANPTGTTSATFAQMGLGATCAITPVYSGRVKVEFHGSITNSVAGDRTDSEITFGTGTAPSNAAAVTGTVLGNLVSVHASGASNLSPFENGGIITGLTVGTAIWIDIALKVSGGTGSVSSLSCSAMEF